MKCPHCSTNVDDVVPKSRLDQEIAKTRAAREEAERQREQVESLRSTATETAATIAERERELQEARAAAERAEALEQERSRWSLERDVYRGGITDDEGVEVARMMYERLPEEQRPQGGIAEWLQQRDQLPVAVRAYMGGGGEQQTQQQQPAATTQPGRQAPTSDAGTRAPSGPTSGAGSVRRPSAYSPQEWAGGGREAVLQELGIRPPDYKGRLRGGDS